MRRSWSMVVGGVVGLVGAAQAQEVPHIQDCYLQPEEKILVCDIHNNGVEAMAGLIYEISIHESGRAAPWGLAESEIRIWGGIEPGETKSLAFEIDGLPESSWDRDLGWTFDGIGLDEDGAPVLTAEAHQARAEAFAREQEERQQQQAEIYDLMRQRAAEAVPRQAAEGTKDSGGEDSVLDFLRGELGIRSTSDE